MFYRITNYEHAPERQEEILDWVATKTELVRAVEGPIAVDVFQAMPGESVIVAAYDDQEAYEAASDTIGGVLGELGQFLARPPVTTSGTPFWTTRT